jgi:hypothetical protein
MRQKQGSSWHSVLIESTYRIRNYMKHIKWEHSFNGANSTNMQSTARWPNRKFDLELTV